MAGDKKKKDGGSYKFSSALIWAGGQFAACWFITPEEHLWTIVGHCVSAFFAGLTTAGLLGRFAKWGANSWVMMILGVLFGVAVFSGAFSGLTAAISWWQTKDVKMDWDKLQAFLLSWSALATVGLGLLTGLYVRAKVPRKR